MRGRKFEPNARKRERTLRKVHSEANKMSVLAQGSRAALRLRCGPLHRPTLRSLGATCMHIPFAPHGFDVTQDLDTLILPLCSSGLRSERAQGLRRKAKESVHVDPRSTMAVSENIHTGCMCV